MGTHRRPAGLLRSLPPVFLAITALLWSSLRGVHALSEIRESFRISDVALTSPRLAWDIGGSPNFWVFSRGADHSSAQSWKVAADYQSVSSVNSLSSDSQYTYGTVRNNRTHVSFTRLFVGVLETQVIPRSCIGTACTSGRARCTVPQEFSYPGTLHTWTGPDWNLILLNPGLNMSYVQCLGGSSILNSVLEREGVAYFQSAMDVANQYSVQGLIMDERPYALVMDKTTEVLRLAVFPKLAAPADITLRPAPQLLLDLPNMPSDLSREDILSMDMVESSEGTILYVGTTSAIYQFGCNISESCQQMSSLGERADALLGIQDRLLAVQGNFLLFLSAGDDCSAPMDTCMAPECYAQNDPAGEKVCGICRTASAVTNSSIPTFSDSCLSSVSCDRSTSVWLTASQANMLPSSATCPLIGYSPQSFLFVEGGATPLVNISAKVQCYVNGALAPPLGDNVGSDWTVCRVRQPNAPETIILEVRTQDTAQDFFYLPVQFVRCTKFTSCDQCVRAHPMCRWSTHTSQCSDTSSGSGDERLLADGCPSFRVQASTDFHVISHEEISVLTPQAGVSRSVDINLELVGGITGLDDIVYTCKSVSRFGETTSSSVSLGILTCTIAVPPLPDVIERQDVYEVEWASASIKRSGSIGLLEVNGYICTTRSFCRECIFGAPRMTNCSWCGDSCASSASECPSAGSGGPALTETAACPGLDVVANMSGPFLSPTNYGELKFKMVGSYLTPSFNLLGAAISIGGQTCEVHEGDTRLVPASRQEIVCAVPISSIPASLDVSAAIEGSVWNSEKKFVYFDYDLKNISRTVGPLWGNTSVEIWGEGLNYVQEVDSNFVVSLVNPAASLPLNCTLDNQRLDCRTPVAQLAGTYWVSLSWMYSAQFQGRNHTIAVPFGTLQFRFYGDPVIASVEPQTAIESGNRPITVTGENFDAFERIQLYIYQENGTRLFSDRDCQKVTDSEVTCWSPVLLPFDSGAASGNTTDSTNGTISTTVPPVVATRRKRQTDTTVSWFVGITVDGVQLTAEPGSEPYSFAVVANPTFNLSSNNLEYLGASQPLSLTGANLDAGAVASDYSVSIGAAGIPCVVTVLSSDLLLCTAPQWENVQEFENQRLLIRVRLYNEYEWTAGNLTVIRQAIPEGEGVPLEYWLPATVSGVVILVATILAACMCSRKAFKYKRDYRAMEKKFDQMEVNVRNECRHAFAELQTQMEGLKITKEGIPWWEYKEYSTNVLFSGRENNASLHKYQNKSRSPVVTKSLHKFEMLLYDKDFLVTFVHTLEKQSEFTSSDRAEVAALLMMLLQPKMTYATSVLKVLLRDLIQHTIDESHPKILLRRSATVVEKLLAHWIAISLYQYLRDFAGEPLFLLASAIKQQIQKGPVDMLTHEARYSLAVDRLLREDVEDCAEVKLLVIPEDNGEAIPCTVLSCDSISQLKEKVLDAMFKNKTNHYSRRPKAQEYCVEWYPSQSPVPIADEDISSRTENGMRRVNTVGHYNMTSNTHVKLTPRAASLSLSTHAGKLKKSYEDLHSKSGSTTMLNFNGGAHDTTNSNVTKWHLSRHVPPDFLSSHVADRAANADNPMMRELFLTRLLITKGILQPYVEDLFKAVFCVNDDLPPTIKWLFDFLDEQARKHKASLGGDKDVKEVTHIWKNNSLHLRFWVNVIKNPNFVFDMHKDQIADSCLTVVASTLIDSCATTDHVYEKAGDAPVNKLLFAKNRVGYRAMVSKYYEDIQARPPVKEEQMKAYLDKISNMNPREFQKTPALRELYWYAEKYYGEILKALSLKHPNLCFPFNDGMGRPTEPVTAQSPTEDEECNSTRGLVMSDKGSRRRDEKECSMSTLL